ncbi:hypothetical protein DUI87_08043 [Hirundo rustica rustica]|uniref:Uncharacterized protein n=1 Tax=Hirundo rustica rustica TaxID=333673 RepID=A0A3M0KRD6_HIRRU|nr:hypothetical protein DUI87_08043 [Hirundo rustica rustica]
MLGGHQPYEAQQGKVPDSAPGMDESWMYGQIAKWMLESSAMEKDLGIPMDGKLNVSQQCTGSQKRQPCRRVHQGQHHQLGKGGDCPTLL